MLRLLLRPWLHVVMFLRMLRCYWPPAETQPRHDNALGTAAPISPPHTRPASPRASGTCRRRIRLRSARSSNFARMQDHSQTTKIARRPKRSIALRTARHASHASVQPHPPAVDARRAVHAFRILNSATSVALSTRTRTARPRARRRASLNALSVISAWARSCAMRGARNARHARTVRRS